MRPISVLLKIASSSSPKKCYPSSRRLLHALMHSSETGKCRNLIPFLVDNCIPCMHLPSRNQSASSSAQFDQIASLRRSISSISRRMAISCLSNRRTFSTLSPKDNSNHNVVGNSSSNSDSNSNSKSNDSTHTSAPLVEEDTSTKGKLKTMWRKYGFIFIGTYLSVYASTLTSIFLLVDNDIITASLFGFESNELCIKKGCDIVEKYFGYQQLPQYIRENHWIGNAVIAWLMTKLTEPIRFGVALVITPKVASFIRPLKPGDGEVLK